MVVLIALCAWVQGKEGVEDERYSRRMLYNRKKNQLGKLEKGLEKQEERS